ncbi:MAG: glycosyltransferase family 4 protein [Candidatus Acidiferrales bacterium]
MIKNPTFEDRSAPRRLKLLFLVTEDWFFWSHRLAVARAAQRNGYEVIVATRVQRCAEQIRGEGFRLIPLQLIRESYSPLNEFRAIQQIRQIYRSEDPDIVHQVALKPVLYGSISALGRKNIPAVNALTGLGYLAASSTRKARFLRLLIWNFFRLFLNKPHQRVIVENPDDKQLLIEKLKVSPERIVLIRGSGVDFQSFQPTAEPSGIPVVLLASRMLWIKGIVEFVEAAKMLRSKGLDARFVLVGDTDPSSPSSVPRQQLLEWQSSGSIEWWGHQTDMPRIFEQASLVCLPSHGGEGVPTVLMEAAASGRAIVTTDVPGCRDIVRNGVNGRIVPPGDAVALAEAIEELLKNSAMRQEMARRGREIAVNEFSQEMIAEQTLALYSELLKSRSSRVAKSLRNPKS